MDAGNLRHRLTAWRQAQPVEYDAAGMVIDRPLQLTTCWGNVRPLTGDERQLVAQLDPTLSHAVTLRYNAATAKITPADWLLYEQRRFDVSSVRNIREDNAVIELFVTERLQ